MPRMTFRPTQIHELAAMGDGSHLMLTRSFRNLDGSITCENLSEDGVWTAVGEGEVPGVGFIFSTLRMPPEIVRLGKISDADRFMIVRRHPHTPEIYVLQVGGGWGTRQPGFIASADEIFVEHLPVKDEASR